MTSTIRAVLTEAAHAGVGLAIVDGRVRVRWRCGERPDLRERLRALRSELLVALAEPPDDHDDPRWAVAVLASVDTWRAWMEVCRARHGTDGPRTNAAGFAAYRSIAEDA